MNLEKTAKAMGDWRTIWMGVLMMISLAAWAGDTRWMLKTGGEQISVQIKFDALEEDIEELTLEKRFETNPAKVKRLDAMIEYKKNKMDSLIKKYSISKDN